MGEESKGKPKPADSVSFQWNDITRQFRDAASSLALGELFRDKEFTLLEAMSAIEMMDPKMDAGMLCNKSQNCSVEEAIAEGKFKVEHLSVNEIRAVLDSSFRCLVSWLEGHCLAQTVFTNLYLHKPALIKDRTMQTLALVSVKLVFVIKEIIYKIGAFEEEDFHGVTYNFYLGQDILDTKACSMIRQCEDDLYKRAKRARQAKEDGSEGNDSEPEGEDPEDIMRLYHRIRFLRLLFQNLSLLECRLIINETMKTLQGVIEEVRVIRRENLDDDDNFPTTPGFDATANQRLLPSTFPRYTKVASCRTAYKYLEDMLLRVQEVMEITGLHSYNQVLHFFSEFSKKSPCVLSRSIGRLVYMPSSGMVYGMTKTTDVLKDAIRTFCRPPVFIAKSAVSQSSECRDWAEGLLLRCCQPLFGLLQVTGHNRARQLEKCTRVLEDLAAVQDEAEKVDGLLLLAQKDAEPNCPIFQWFTMWLISYILKTQIAYLLMGFELDLYAEHEYCYIFWYLHEYLYRFLVTTLSQADSYMLECDKKLRKQKKDTRCTKPKKITKGYHYKELLSTQIMQSVCGGFYKTMMALRMDGRLKFPHAEFDSEKIRFEHRFEAFQAVATPRVVTYEQYCEINDLSRYGNLTPSGMYDAASKCFKQAKTLLESAGELCPDQQALLKISKNNMIVVNLLQTGHRKEASITFERGHHMYFPLIKLS